MNRPLVLKSAIAFVGCVALIGLGVVAGQWWSPHASTSANSSNAESPTAAVSTPKVLYWYDPMVPQHHFDKPGKSPFMDMELSPRYADENNARGERDALSGPTIDPNQTQNLGVRLAAVVRIPSESQVEASGKIGFNERDVAIMQARSGGFVERVWPLAPGDIVKAGQPLVTLLVPEWVVAQHELFAVKVTGDSSLISAARDRLQLLGMPNAMIKTVEKGKKPLQNFTLSAPISGVLQSLDVRAGMALVTGQTLAQINGIGNVWLEIAIPEALGRVVHVGSKVNVRLSDLGGISLLGKVTTILSTLNETTRSVRARVELPNKDGRMRPGMTAQVTLSGAQAAPALAVPTEAVIRTGKRTIVIVVDEAGRYAQMEVTLGKEIGSQTVIIAGLSEGQKIVASGQFLIDSEAYLNGAQAPTTGGTL